MKIRFTVDTLAIGLLLGLATIAGFIILWGESAGVQARTDVPESGVVGPFEAVTFTFSEVIDSEITSDLISIDPIHEGYLEWVDTYSMRYVPLKPFERGVTYSVKIGAGEININGREVKKSAVLGISRA